MANVVKCGTCGKRRKRALGTCIGLFIGSNSQFRLTLDTANVGLCVKCREAILDAAAKAAVKEMNDLSS